MRCASLFDGYVQMRIGRKTEVMAEKSEAWAFLIATIMISFYALTMLGCVLTSR
jgi:hypothetical protein